MGYFARLETIVIRGTAAVLIFVVFMGGICPPLYEGILPHDHLFIGGPPPPNWEDHHHHDPLAALFGSNAEEQPVRMSEPAILGIVGVAQEETGKVVSLYAAPQILILSVLSLAMLLPALWLLISLTMPVRIRTDLPSPVAAEPAAPRPPPPRWQC